MTNPIRSTRRRTCRTAALGPLVSAAGLAPVPHAKLPATAAQSAEAPTLTHCERCVVPDRDAKVITPVVRPDIPDTISSSHWSGTTAVRVRLSETGAVADASLAESSGNPWLDRIALETASATRFTGEVKDCQSTAGTYLYYVTAVSGETC